MIEWKNIRTRKAGKELKKLKRAFVEEKLWVEGRATDDE